MICNLTILELNSHPLHEQISYCARLVLESGLLSVY